MENISQYILKYWLIIINKYTSNKFSNVKIIKTKKINIISCNYCMKKKRNNIVSLDLFLNQLLFREINLDEEYYILNLV